MMDKYQTFKLLHHADDILFLGNCHDVLSAMALEEAGFKAIGTTSWGVANSLGFNDGEKIDFNDYLFIIKKIVRSVAIPVSVDIEAGYSAETKDIVTNVLAVADAGAAGINLEDSLKDRNELRDINLQADVFSAIRSELDKKGFKDFFINARTDTYLQTSENTLEETIERGQAYALHGSDGFFVPGLVDEETISKIIRAVGLPLNIMSFPNITDLTKFKELNVKRLSFGNAFSDRIIADMEKISRALIQSSNTKILYDHDPITLNFNNAS